MRVLIAYDGSAAARAAVRAAGALLVGAEALVTTVHHFPAGLEHVRLGEALRARLEEAAHRDAQAIAEEGARLAAGAGLAAEPLAVPARGVAARIVALAGEREVDLVVCGARGRTGFARALLGSVSASVLHHADRPVLVVPEGGGSLTGPVVLAYDGSEEARAAIAATGRLLPGRQAVVVHAWESPLRHTLTGRVLGAAPVEDVRELASDLGEALAGAARATVDEGVELAREAGLDATGEPLESSASAWRAVAEAAQASGAALIATGSRGHGLAGSVLLGSVSSGLVGHAEVPTLVVAAHQAQT